MEEAEMTAISQSSYRIDSILKWTLTILVWFGVAYQMLATQFIFHSAMEHQIIFFGIIVLIITLSCALSATHRIEKYFWLTVAVCGIIATGYCKVFYEHLEEVVGFPEIDDAIIGVLLIIIVVVVTYKSWGFIFPFLVVLGIGYFFLGHLLPHPLFHPQMPLLTGISFLSLGFGTGIFGALFSVMSDYLFLIIFFGGLLETMGANSFFIELGKAGAKFSKAGPAQTAVIGSSCMGTVIGSAISNVMITGAITIPTMKKFGFKPEMAGAIEASASTGSLMMPPIMGATSFIMASFLGIPYSTVMLAAIIPAFLYYLGVCANVELLVRKAKINPPKEPVNYKMLFDRALVFVIPLGFLITLLIMQKSPGYTAFYAILIILFIGILKKTTRPSLKRLSQGFVNGAVAASKISIVIAAVAILTQVIVTTALGTKMAYIVGAISGDSLTIRLILTMILSIFLGCGLPAPAAYALVAILVVPSIVNLGIPALQIHFFVLWFAVMSAITPPVALASLGAAAIAKANYFKVSVGAVKLAFNGYVVPFFIVFNPVILGRFDNAVNTITSLVGALFTVLFSSIALYGYLFYKLSIFMRIMVASNAVIFATYVITLRPSWLYLGVLFGLSLVLWQIFQLKRDRFEDAARQQATLKIRKEV